jgi:transposase-like protein
MWHFVGEIILWAVRWYCKYGISYRELEEMMEERGVDLDHTTVYRWVQRYARLQVDEDSLRHDPRLRSDARLAQGPS